MSDQELFPSYDTASAKFERFYFESAIFDIEYVSLLCHYPREESHNCPRKEASIRCRVTPIAEAI